MSLSCTKHVQKYFLIFSLVFEQAGVQSLYAFDLSMCLYAMGALGNTLSFVTSPERAETLGAKLILILVGLQ